MGGFHRGSSIFILDKAYVYGNVTSSIIFSILWLRAKKSNTSKKEIYCVQYTLNSSYI